MTTFSAGQDNLISYKVYIAGQYAPAQQIVAQQGIFSFSEAKISLFPHKALVNFGENDRVPVQIFFLDTWYDAQHPEYKLMFDGEITDVSYTRTPSSASMDISCVNSFEILAQMFVRLFSDLTTKTSTDIGNATTALDTELGLSQLLNGGIVHNGSDEPLYKKPASTLAYLFTKSYMDECAVESNSKPIMKRPFVLLRNILLNLSNGKSIAKSRKEVNLFFKCFLSKRNLFTSIFASPLVEEVQTKNKLNNKTLEYAHPTANPLLDAITNQATYDSIVSGFSLLVKSIGENQTVSYWEIFARMYSIIMFESIMPLCPPLLKANIFGIPDVNRLSGYDGIMQLLSKPTLNFGVPLVSNIIFPCMINNMGVRNLHFTKPTRYYLRNPSIITRQGQSTAAGATPVDQIYTNSCSDIYPVQLKTKSVGGISVPLLPSDYPSIASRLMWSNNPTTGHNEYFKGPVVLQQGEAPDWINFVKQGLTNTKDLVKETNGKEGSSEATNSIITNIGSVISRYSQNEFQKEVASKRVVSLDLKFNPYLVAGFPAAIIDNVDWGQYFLAMPTRVVHILSTSSASTSVDFTNVTTFKEAYKDNISTFTNSESNTVKCDVGPTHPSSNVASVFNINSQASDYYKKVFFQNNTSKNNNSKKYIFDPSDYFALTTDKEIDVTKNDTIYRKGVKLGISNYMNNYEEALTYISRPIASITDYLQTRLEIHYMSNTGNHLTINDKEGLPHAGTISVSGMKLFNGADVPSEVLRIVTGISIEGTTNKLYPGIPIYFEQILGYTFLGQAKKGIALFNARPTDLDDYPDFIEDWATKIQTYRTDILSGQDILIG